MVQYPIADQQILHQWPDGPSSTRKSEGKRVCSSLQSNFESRFARIIIMHALEIQDFKSIVVAGFLQES